MSCPDPCSLPTLYGRVLQCIVSLLCLTYSAKETLSFLTCSRIEIYGHIVPPGVLCDVQHAWPLLAASVCQRNTSAIHCRRRSTGFPDETVAWMTVYGAWLYSPFWPQSPSSGPPILGSGCWSGALARVTPHIPLFPWFRLGVKTGFCNWLQTAHLQLIHRVAEAPPCRLATPYARFTYSRVPLN